MRFKRTPLPHQLEEFETSKDLEARMLPWEMGAAKTKVALDTAAHLYLAGKIKGVVLIAPRGVHEAWVLDAIPEDLSPDVEDQIRSFVWYTSRSKTKKFQRELKSFEAHEGLAFLAVTYHSIMSKSKDCAMAVKRFLEKRKCLLILDESHKIKSPKAKRTIRVLSMAKYAPYRRCLSGTPIEDKPFDLYSQLVFLDQNIWRPLGISSFPVFRAFFGVYQKRQFMQYGKLREFNELKGFRNLDMLHTTLARLGKRILKSQVLGLPPKVYTKRYFDLNKEQEAAYRQLKDEYSAWLGDMESCTALLAMQRILRFQQITSGYLPTDESGRLFPLGKTNPRLECFREFAQEASGKVVVWAKFTEDINGILNVLKQEGIEAVRYDGRVHEADRTVALERFVRGTARFFVGNATVGGEGLNLQVAQTVAFYNTTYKMGERLQAEDRVHRHGQEKSVLVVDFVARGTVDERIIAAIRTKRETAEVVYGDEIRAWV